MQYTHLPKKQGLYDPSFEHDACGVGFVCNIKGKRSNEIVRQGLQVLNHLSHRGATGADPKTGDGAGILIQIPHEFFARVCKKTRIELPEAGDYGTGIVFLPTNAEDRASCKKIIAGIVEAEGQRLLGWRKVPLDSTEIGKTAKRTQPAIEQLFIGKDLAGSLFDGRDALAFERKLYVIRKQAENAIRSSKLEQRAFFYISSLSCRTISYKGLLMPAQVQSFFVDLREEDVSSSLCLVHSRYSTNTFPTWDLAQPFRFLAHNGEINTLRGNINWMRAREDLLASGLFGKDLKKIGGIIVPGGSDSAMLDNVFELLLLAGRPLEHAMMMLIPPAWEQNTLMDAKLKDFYRYHACLMEPWDGPAAVAFTDGVRIGAVLDRNGLRPARYIVTADDRVIMASEVGVLDLAAGDIVRSGRLEPGKIFFIDTEKGRIIDDAEIKQKVAGARDYGAWIRENMVDLDTLPPQKNAGFAIDQAAQGAILASLKAFGYSREDLEVIIKPMAEKGAEPIGSMGNDTPPALLSDKPQLLYTYFKQLFAQVTNPAIDPIREELVMSLESYVGPQKNILDESSAHCHTLLARRPILTNEELEKIRHIKAGGFTTKTISLLFKTAVKNDFSKTLDKIRREAVSAIDEGYSFVILSDRGVDTDHAALPALLAMGAVHHHLVKKSLRARIGIVIESAEPREVHHFGLLFGYGADCVNPYLAYDAVNYLINDKDLALDLGIALHNYIKSVDKGIQKILSKMGISTLQGYRGAQIFEALGLSDEVIDECFTGTVSRIGGVSLDIIAQETLLRHAQAFPKRGDQAPFLATGGVYQWKRDGEFHLWGPESVAALQDAARNADPKRYKDFAALINDQSKAPTTLRSLLRFKKTKPVPIEEVESIETIVKRFATGAMSFGSISKGAHETLAIAMNRLGARSNTGEGGEDPARFAPLPNGDSARSSIKQVASGRFGVTTNYLVNADELQIKISQGAKPGEGGQLPGHKVSAIIARTRYTTPGVTLISPPPHHDIYSIE
ncbi:MAG: glutamate synthase large subunit, partial [Candidatus Omnitrophota bacterium]